MSSEDEDVAALGAALAENGGNLFIYTLNIKHEMQLRNGAWIIFLASIKINYIIKMF